MQESTIPWIIKVVPAVVGAILALVLSGDIDKNGKIQVTLGVIGKFLFSVSVSLYGGSAFIEYYDLSKYSHMTLPRAVVAGIINSDDTTNMKDLVYVAYSMKIHEGNDFHFPKNTQETLTSLGFNLKYPVKTTIITDAKQIRSVYDDFKHYREKVSPFFLDGIVMKMNEKYRHD